MIQLAYISSATSWPTEDDLLSLLEQSRARNARQNVTGLLLYHKATYMQVLEGDEKDVHEIFHAIQQDPRNNAVVKLLEGPIEQRSFPDWWMGFHRLEDGELGEVSAYLDIGSGRIDSEAIVRHPSVAVDLLMNFAAKD